MSELRHRAQYKQGHPSQPAIKNLIYNCERKDIKHLLNILNSAKKITNIIGEKNTKELFFLLSQDEASFSNILECTKVYKKDRNYEELKYTLRLNKPQLNKTNSI